MRAATEMSLVSTWIPAGSVNVRMIGRKAYVASSGASSVSGSPGVSVRFESSRCYDGYQYHVEYDATRGLRVRL
jgi:hypothetical protein